MKGNRVHPGVLSYSKVSRSQMARVCNEFLLTLALLPFFSYLLVQNASSP